MEIERKFRLLTLPKAQTPANFHLIEQAYLCTAPVVRIRRQDEEYYLTYKGAGMMCREEYNLPLNKEAYEHLLPKADGNLISKKRFLFPLSPDSAPQRDGFFWPREGLTAEIDEFFESFRGLMIAEVEFPDMETAEAFVPPSWFGIEVTSDKRFHNSYLSKLPPEKIPEFLHCL